MKKFVQYIPFLLILLVSVTLFVKVNQNEKNAADKFFGASQMIGKNIPEYPMEALSDEKRKLTAADFKGGYTVINLFASWCVACLYEHKYIKELKGVEGVDMIGIAWRDKRQDALDWLNKNGDPYDDVALDTQGKFGILLGVTGIPETFLVDKNGVIVMHFARTVTEDDVNKIKENIKN